MSASFGSVTFELTLRFGRKQKHKTYESSVLLNASNDKSSGKKSRPCKRMKADNSGTETKEKVAHHTHDDQKSTTLVNSHSSDCKRQKAPTEKKMRLKMAKGKHFCEGLQVAKSVQLKPWPKPMKMSTPSLVCWPRVAIKSENSNSKIDFQK